jgi:predicted HD phosphohydrolase
MSEDPIDELRHLFLSFGRAPYVDAVTHLEHALQCGALAEREGAPAWLVTAALTHDIGQLLLTANAIPGSAEDEDDHHEVIGANWLADRFDGRVARTVAAHVAARRYLCATETGYMRLLPIERQRALALQGGPMCSIELGRFESDPVSREAIRITRWDDRAVQVTDGYSRLEHFLSIARLARSPRTAVLA